MSTHSTIKHHWDSETESGFHLYSDFLDQDPVVHLRLDGVHFSASSDGSLEVAIPQVWAEQLGLVKDVPEVEKHDTEER